MGHGKAKLAPLRNAPSAASRVGHRTANPTCELLASRRRTALWLVLVGAQGFLGGWNCREEQGRPPNEGAGVLGLCVRPAIYRNSRNLGVLDL
jgi:hypothetical protein